MNYKAIVFSRVSTEHQDLVQQTDEVLNEALKNGYVKDDIILIEQKESAIKLDEEERIGLNQLKEAISKYPIECVFVYEISRISRRPKVLYSIRDLLIERNIQLICIKPYLKLLEDGKLSQTASIMFSIFASLSESEMMLKKERMQRGVKHARLLGKHAGGQIMYGYKTDKNHNYIIDEAKSTVVKRIFNEYVYGDKSMRTLARDLQEEGHFKGIKFLTVVQEIYNILHHDCYCGRKNGMPAIISEELYDQSVEKRKSSELKVSHVDNMALCKGLLRDADSGLLLSSNTAAKSYYSKRQSGVSVGMHIIEPIIWEYAVKLHKEHSKIDTEQAFAILNRQLQYNERKIYTLTNKLYELQQRKDKIEERLIMGKISETKADELETQIDNEISEVKKRLREINTDNESIRREGNRIYKTKDAKIEYSKLDKKEKYEIVHLVIDRIMLKRESRYVLNIAIYDKMNEKPNIIRFDTYNKKLQV